MMVAHAKATTLQSESIVWAFTATAEKTSSVQPFFLTSRSELFRLYYKNLSDYNHSIFTGSIPRIESELKNKKLVCYPGSSSADKRKEFTYSTPQYIQPAPRLITRKEIADKILKKGEKSISLREILHHKELNGLITEARSYGPSADKIIAEKPNNLKTQFLDTFGSTILQSIAAGRVDYTLEYDFIVRTMKEGNPRFTELVSLPISDTSSTIVQYLACSKTPEGLAVIKRADEVIRKNIARSEYWKAFLESIPANERGSFQSEIDKYIAERTKAPVIVE